MYNICRFYVFPTWMVDSKVITDSNKHTVIIHIEKSLAQVFFFVAFIYTKKT